MKETAITIAARDGYPLSALVLEPSSPRAVILLAGGTGIKKEFYLHFSRHLCQAGYIVLLFDYRGIGASRPKSLRGFEAYNHEWGTKDMTAALDWLDVQFPDLKKYLIGHSAGGQQLGLMDNAHKLEKALLISSSIGYWNWLSSPYKYFTLFVWYVMVPLGNATLGYVPASWFGLGEDLPKNVANEWRSWCLRSDYYRSFLGNRIPHHFFEKVTYRVHFLYPEDDTIGTPKTVEALKNFYSQASTSVERIVLREYGLSKVGHLGFFSRKVKDQLWPKALHFIES